MLLFWIPPRRHFRPYSSAQPKDASAATSRLSLLATLSAATAVFLALGSTVFRDRGDDARVVDEFFRRLKGDR